MYPVPSSAAGWKPGTTEEYIGTWIEQNPTLRSEIILATKIAGFNPGSETGGNRFVPPKPSADCRLDRESVLMACDASLRRLRTDYIDLYQLHWPDRYAPNFGQSVYDPTKERGVNFIDTAEMYPVPSSAAGWKPGTTEEYIGTWIEKNPTLRSEIILATKIAGFNPGSETGGNRFVPPKPSADCRLDRESVLMACDASLRRLRTDYIDLYQLHWPDRYAPNFGQSVYDPTKERDAVPIKETVAALGELISAGKIRHYGLSNETTYGVCEFVRAADELGVPRPVSIQNSFCLLHRTFETELAEACAPSHYDIGLLPWTPLAGGALSGKYLHGKKPAEGRLVKFPAFMQRYLNAPCVEATEAYEAIAKEAGVSLATLSLAWCRTRWYCASTIIGATTMEQLKENIDAFDADLVTLSEETLKKIDDVHFARRDPCMIPTDAPPRALR